jgi:transcription initiation factor IIF auxiliary subunit
MQAKMFPNPPVNQVKFNNMARLVEQNDSQKWYEWIVFVDESNEVLELIKEVDYLLHPTFPNPRRSKKDPTIHFALESSGWGVFRIAITVFFKNGARLETSYYLDFSKSWNWDAYLGKTG